MWPIELIGVPWKCLMFANGARPKARFTLWLQLQNRLLTTDRLLTWGIDVDQSCKLCQGQVETRDHLFGHCPFTQNLWQRLLRWLMRPYHSVATWEDHLEWVISHTKGNSQDAQILRLVYIEYVHTVWIERNQQTFENKSRLADDS
ncbi:uncharacterized protein LOC132032017 [Lycium ferocissimum]|uniref:uncharacterized protein LOC132032017 n=1 Tax=Lycium ferocissimum TaxID=112874 RepID=UPI0028165597|nr:uncharacterized protein LOC132032017 [Lycium ferocissimum]